MKMSQSEVSKLLNAIAEGRTSEVSDAQFLELAPASVLYARLGNKSWAGVCRLACTSELRMNLLADELSAVDSEREQKSLYAGARGAIAAHLGSGQGFTLATRQGLFYVTAYDGAAAAIKAEKAAAARAEKQRQETAAAAAMAAHDSRVAAALDQIIDLLQLEIEGDPSTADYLEAAAGKLEAMLTAPAGAEAMEAAAV